MAQEKMTTSRMLTTEQAAGILNVHPSTLEKGRQSHRKGLFPPYYKIGCPRALNFDPPCALNFDPGVIAARH